MERKKWPFHDSRLPVFAPVFFEASFLPGCPTYQITERPSFRILSFGRDGRLWSGMEAGVCFGTSVIFTSLYSTLSQKPLIFTNSNMGTSYRPQMHTSTEKKKKKGKAIPLQAWRGPEGSRRLRFPDFKAIGT